MKSTLKHSSDESIKSVCSCVCLSINKERIFEQNAALGHWTSAGLYSWSMPAGGLWSCQKRPPQAAEPLLTFGWCSM
jgi:hypothetical protein